MTVAKFTEFPSSLGQPFNGLPTDCHHQILDFAISIFDCPKAINQTHTSIRLRSILGRFNQQRTHFRNAHTKIKQLSAIILFSRLSQSNYDLLKPHMDGLRQGIISLCTDGHQAFEGPRFLRQMIDHGCYLKVLRIYIQAVPKAIWNEAGNIERNDGYDKTLLDSAITPNYPDSFSLPFAKFLIETIKKNGMLDVLSYNTGDGQTALQKFQRYAKLMDCENKQGMLEIEQLLTELKPSEPEPKLPSSKNLQDGGQVNPDQMKKLDCNDLLLGTITADLKRDQIQSVSYWKVKQLNREDLKLRSWSQFLVYTVGVIVLGLVSSVIALIAYATLIPFGIWVADNKTGECVIKKLNSNPYRLYRYFEVYVNHHISKIFG